MPRSKRNKVVNLTKTNPKGKGLKCKHVEGLRQATDDYTSLFAFSFDNLRASSTVFKDVRMHWKESRIYLGKNTIAQVALGRTPEEEFKDNLRHVSKLLNGDCGLLFTSRDKAEVLEYFNSLELQDFAKAGFVPDRDIVLNPGPLPTDFGSSMLDQLRKLGMVVEVDDSKVILRNTFHAAVKDSPLTPEQSKVLTHLNIKLATFSIQMLCYWSDGTFEELS